MDDARSAPAMLDDSPWRRLMHRWLIQYNPLYLVSAALVLVGVILSSQGLAGGGTAAQLGVTAIAEVYAWALIGGAALLVRIHLRRPAVMLALLAALYQCDLTLHTETCAFLGFTGVLGSLGWLVGFVAKLRALAWAIRLRVSRSAFVVACLGATMITLFPWLLRALDGQTASSLLAAALFGIFSAALWTTRRVQTEAVQNSWAATVAWRSLWATWAGWAAMMLFHVGFWFSQHSGLEAVALLPGGMLLSTRLAKRESTTWLIVLGTLAYVGVVLPHLFALTAGMAAVTLGLRALRQPVVPTISVSVPAPAGVDVYRVDATAQPPQPPRWPLPPSPMFVVAPRGERLRLLTGAAGCLYLAAWTQGWSGGPWPPHIWWLDLLLVVASVAAFANTRFHALLVLPGLALTHLVVSLRLVSGPQSTLQWGIACISVGFALLGLLLAFSVRWRHRQVARSRLEIGEDLGDQPLTISA